MSRADRLFPEIEPFDHFRLAVDDLHTLYVEQAGRPDGLPVLFLHGGPGSGCRAEQRRYFDPDRFRIVLFDQRGAGRSTPKGCLENNTTAHLVGDIERIRERLGIERWMVVGGSWGATLAVAYAEAHPRRVGAMALRSVFLGTREEFRWAFEGAAQTFRPELWREFADLLPEDERNDPVAAYGARLTHPDESVRRGAARAWGAYERALSVLHPPAGRLLPDSLEAPEGGNGPASPFFEWHYMSHECFLAPRQLPREARRLKGIPGIIVEGRYDLLCPPETAESLIQDWTTAELRIAVGGAHDVKERGILPGLMAAIDELGRRMR